MASDLSAKEIEKGKFAFSIFDFEGNDSIDAYNLGDVLRALGLNPTNKLVEKMGGSKKKNEKKLKVDEFLPIYSQVRKDKDVGNIDDYMECLKLYDKAGDGKMIGAELNHILQALGEGMSKFEAEDIMKDCAEAEDEDGFINYTPFLKKLMAGPYPETE